ncbi:MAG: NAD(P)H-dependent oxidoreductase [Saprospiraceae bacterium]|jgi:NAD(P)H-dependent FMN reductase|nr:NAD(P)H-dependent oxidoreductase [Saprospiraceae bacterium]
MKITIVMGSHRPEAQSLKVAKYLSKRLTDLKVCDEVYILNLAIADIPFYDEGLKKKEGIWKTNWEPIENELASSDGFIIISPEWGGMVPAKLKNFFLLPNTISMAHKPALIVSVSEGFGGSYPINELRTSSYKNTHICYIPQHVIIRKIKLCLNDELAADNDFDKLIRPRIDYSIQLLGHYCEAFIPLRKTDFNFNQFPFGM